MEFRLGEAHKLRLSIKLRKRMTSVLRVNNVGKLAQAQLPRGITVLYVLLLRRWQEAMHSPRTEGEYCHQVAL